MRLTFRGRATARAARSEVMARLVVLVVLLAVAGCGGGSRTSPRSDVTIRFDRDGPGGRPPVATRLSCTGAGPRACAALRALPLSAFDPVPSTVACTAIYAGPQTAVISGTIRGLRVDGHFSRRNGCQEARYQRVVALLRAALGARGPITPTSQG
jgi:hypothetical protein